MQHTCIPLAVFNALSLYYVTYMHTTCCIQWAQFVSCNIHAYHLLYTMDSVCIMQNTCIPLAVYNALSLYHATYANAPHPITTFLIAHSPPTPPDYILYSISTHAPHPMTTFLIAHSPQIHTPLITFFTASPHMYPTPWLHSLLHTAHLSIHPWVQPWLTFQPPHLTWAILIWWWCVHFCAHVFACFWQIARIQGRIGKMDLSGPNCMLRVVGTAPYLQPLHAL